MQSFSATSSLNLHLIFCVTHAQTVLSTSELDCRLLEAKACVCL